MSSNIGGNGGQPPFSIDFETEGIPPALGSIVKWGLVAIAVILLIVFLNFARGVYTNLLWFDALGYRSVFVKILTTRIWLFFAGGLGFGLMLVANLYFANKYSQGEIGLPLPESSKALLRRLIFWGMVLAVFFVSLIFGTVFQGRWEIFLRLINSTSFGEVDPVFSNDISFYVFTMPVLHFLQGWLLGAVIFIILAVIGLYFLNYVLRALPFSITPALRVHVSILGAILLFLIAWGHYLDRWELLLSSQGAVFGAAYTDLNVRKWALIALTVIAVAAGGLLLANVRFKGLRLIVGAAALWIVFAILLGGIYPAIVQRFRVTPSEFTKEAPYIQRSIEFTRKGFALDRIQGQPFPAKEVLTQLDLQQNPETVNNIRLWDHRPLRNVYNQIQFVRLYYAFPGIDSDRYTINGDYRQVMLGVREIDSENLPPEAQGWVNRKLQYTHGLGVAISPVTDFTEEGKPNFLAQDIPPQGVLAQEEPRIYYGENTLDYVIANTNIDEIDFPTGQDLPARTKYEGNGGVRLSNLLRKIAYAWQLGEVNVLISGEINSESVIMYRRSIQNRIDSVAPFLTLDQDPYIVVAEVDGKSRLFWIQDAYTTTDRYPYSEPTLLGVDSFNYMRNSVKVVMDALNGSLDFYVFHVADEEPEPIVRTYQSIFPDLFKDMSEMPQSLQEHIRYPIDFFSIQAEKYLTFHMSDPQEFYNREDQWSLPTELFFGAVQEMEPYYLIMRIPGEEREEFVLLLPFTPKDRPNMVGWLAARSDAPNYGTLISFEFPKDIQIDGPQQVEARIDIDPVISPQFTLLCQSGSTCIRGNLLVIPMGESLLYIEPLYIQAEALDFPELKRVIAVTKDKVVMEDSLAKALARVVGPGVALPPEPGAPPSGPPVVIPEELREFIDSLGDGILSLQEELSKLEEALTGLKGAVEGR